MEQILWFIKSALHLPGKTNQPGMSTVAGAIPSHSSAQDEDGHGMVLTLPASCLCPASSWATALQSHIQGQGAPQDSSAASQEQAAPAGSGCEGS